MATEAEMAATITAATETLTAAGLNSEAAEGLIARAVERGEPDLQRWAGYLAGLHEYYGKGLAARVGGKL